MREIKFRVWNIIEGKWNGLYHTSPKMVGELACINGIYLVPESVSRNLVVQQYTGVMDCEGKPIYEGDIVWLNSAHSSESWEKENNRFEIIFHRGTFQLKPIKLSKPQGNGVGGGNQQFSHIVEIVGHDKDDSPIYKYLLPPPRPLSSFGICEVMGNVFENPELLT